MQQTETQLKVRHYPLLKELENEERQEISEKGMRRRSVAISLLQEYQRLPMQPTLVSSADGALEGLHLNIPAYALSGPNNPLWNIYQDLIQKLPPHTHLHILTHESVYAPMEEWLQSQELMPRVKLYALPDSCKMTVWAEDDFELVLDKADDTLFMVQPHSNRRTGDENASHYSSSFFNWPRVKVPIYFEGGNILVGDNFFFVGADYGVNTFLDMQSSLNPEQYDRLNRLVCERFKKYLDHERKLFLIGSTVQIPSEKRVEFEMNGEKWEEEYYHHNTEGTVQPVFHIDMFITLAGRNEAGKYQVLVGDPQQAASILDHDFITRLNPMAFDDIAATLSRLGFEVIRNPLPLVYVDDLESKLRKWYYASYNNVLVEITSPTDKTVWLPTYGHGNWEQLKRTDEENKAIWEKLGFKVVLLTDFHPFAEFSGSVHCIKKYVKRNSIKAE
ncbi:hypothetical protein [uncultured Pontibacter sp.]|uniref:hypothetical protein n=1 Tax=uncultured Pontibacter sp. TaxID=453356 RepID=UPI002633D16A|nr:hypothetical protein [uncultured Pontibacter sp.]